MSKAKIAVVGTGWWATTAHLPALKQNPRAEVVLVDTNPQALEAAGKKYEIPAQYTRLTDALNDHQDIMGAVIAVPHAAHHLAAKEALMNSLHILLEKPMTLYAWEAKELVETAKTYNRQIMMGYTFPYLDPMRQAKKWMDEGLLGDIEYITCSMSSMTVEFLRGKPEEYRQVMGYPVTGPSDATYSDPQMAGGGQAQLQITHSAAMMFHFTESQNLRAEVVAAFMNTLDAKVDVVDAFTVRMNNGALATVGSTGNIGKGDGGIVEVHLHGSKGRLLADAISGGVHLRLHNGREEKIAPTYPPYPGQTPARQFVELLLDKADNPFPGETNGLYTVELLDAAYRSAAQNGQPFRVESLYL
ncbi:MAG: Gfo/Idh/MocA family oxidoreductase [Anaerolineae bacterium]|nr:Gfo/Idh/MocA family oxidoreductase [Anaerolineae bacterium]